MSDADLRAYVAEQLLCEEVGMIDCRFKVVDGVQGNLKRLFTVWLPLVPPVDAVIFLRGKPYVIQEVEWQVQEQEKEDIPDTWGKAALWAYVTVKPRA